MTKTEADLWLDYLFASTRLVEAAAYVAVGKLVPIIHNHRPDLVIQHVEVGCLPGHAKAL